MQSPPIFNSLQPTSTPQSFSHSLLSPPSPIIIVPKKFINKSSRLGAPNIPCKKFGNLITAMPCTSLVEPSSEGNGAVRSFKLKESTFLASQMPKKEIAADRFIESHPHYDGRGVIIAIFDSGVDPAAAGLRVTSDGKPKVIDVIDCTGSGDVDTSTIVKADDDGCIRGASGASLVINSSWKNPSGEWHVGCKLVYELFTNTLMSRVKKERKKRWDDKNQEAIAEAVKQLDEFDKKHTKVEEVHSKRVREDLQNRVDLLRKQADSYDDKGPVIDAVVWHDGEVWRAALDTQSLEDEPGCGKLADFVPLTNYKLEQKHGVFSKLDACTCVLNVYNGGNILSIVTDSSPHATHVAGIAAAFHPEEPLLNGVAPGAQIVSCKIGDSRLGSMETGTGLTRALIVAVEHKCDVINMSYGEATLLLDYGRFVDLVNEVVNKHRLIFVSSAGNNGPALTTVGAPGGTTSTIIGVGAYVSPAMAAGAHLLVEPPTEGLEYTWSSRGPTADGDVGVCISAPGGAVAPVPTWTLQRRMLMNGTSMSSPSACGGVALLVSAMKAEGIPVSPYSVRKALENTAIPVSTLAEEKLTAGQGLMQVDKAYEYIQKVQNLPCMWYQVKIRQAGITSKPTSSSTSRGIYLREPNYCHQSTEWTVEVEPKFHEDANNLDQLVPFEECIQLHSTGGAVVRAPEYLLLTNNGRSFSIVVDPTNLSDGLHYYEVYGIDSKAPWRGPLFRIPVTITKPTAVKISTSSKVDMEGVAGKQVGHLFENISSFFRQCIFSVLSVGPVPGHIAFIMDGNRRYSKKQNLVDGHGHRAGFSALMNMLKYCYELGVKYITVYAFSIDNFKRRPEEVESLMKLMQEKIDELIKEKSIINRLGIRIYFQGNLKLLSEPVRSAAERAMVKTAANSRAVLSVCVAYTSTDEIVHAVQESCEEKWDEIRKRDANGGNLNGLQENGKDKDEHLIGVTNVDRHMYMAVVPDPDIIIRTSGETRLSNFLLWQSAHCILYSPTVLWPEIGFRHLVWVVLDFQRNYLYLKEKKKQV